jgi:hypothetical protein
MEALVSARLGAGRAGLQLASPTPMLQCSKLRRGRPDRGLSPFSGKGERDTVMKALETIGSMQLQAFEGQREIARVIVEAMLRLFRRFR